MQELSFRTRTGPLRVAENNFYKVQGTVADMEKTFHVSIHNFSYKGQTLRSNTADPSVDKSSNGHIAAVTGLDDFGFEPLYALPSDPNGAPLPMRPVSVTPQGVFFEGQCFRGLHTETFTNAAAKPPQRTRQPLWRGNLEYPVWPSCALRVPTSGTGHGLRHDSALCSRAGRIRRNHCHCGCLRLCHHRRGRRRVLPDLRIAAHQFGKGQGLVNSPKGPPRNWTIETTLDVEWAHAVAPGAKIALVLATQRGSLDEAVRSGGGSPPGQ